MAGGPELHAHSAEADHVSVGEAYLALHPGFLVKRAVLAREIAQERAALRDHDLGVAAGDARDVEAEDRGRVAADEVRSGGWLSQPTVRASFSNRWSRSGSPATAAGRTFTATVRPRRASRAR